MSNGVAKTGHWPSLGVEERLLNLNSFKIIIPGNIESQGHEKSPGGSE